jgi:phospholipase C
MKLVSRTSFTLFFLTLFGATFVFAANPPHFNHIVIIFQENRTPDNLFGAGGCPASEPEVGVDRACVSGLPDSSRALCGVEEPFEEGVDIATGGYGYINGHRQKICSVPLELNVKNFDPDHSRNNGWVPQYHNGQMDGFCQIHVKGQCVQYSYVIKSEVQPYFDIATSYGFANYMFQTNQGPSFPAHQFILSGTSAPVSPPVQYFDWFVANNGPLDHSGCPDTHSHTQWVDPKGNLYTEPNKSECYDHPTLVDLLDNHTDGNGDAAPINWRYYTPTPDGIWTAPAAIQKLCYDLNHIGEPCDSADWKNNVIWPGKFTNGIIQPGQSTPVLSDIEGCQLQAVSWVIPDKRHSDHPNFGQDGPSYVASIVNAIGNAKNCDNGAGYWSDTVIFITWDDWGGWYDHVPPPVALEQDPKKGFTLCDPSSQWGCGYVYGFRVPLLVVSKFTPAGYVSGACQFGTCRNNVFPYQHDFGSILAFIENNFGLGRIAPPGQYSYEYADVNAPDLKAPFGPLGDFFQSAERDFTQITPTAGWDMDYFLNYYTITRNQPDGPDGDSADE